MANEVTTLPLFAGEKRDVAITLARDGIAIDLTGTTVFIIGKKSLTDADADAIIARQAITEHTDPEGGITSFAVDLTALDDSFFESHTLLHSAIVLKSASGNVENFGVFKIEIQPSPLRSTS